MKKILVFLITLTLVFTMISCEKDDESKSESETHRDNESIEQTEKNTDAEETTSASDTDDNWTKVY